MTDDPCDCRTVCTHGDQCLGGHAYHPSSHWYMCDTCTPKRVLTMDEVREAIRTRRMQNRE